MSQGRLIALTGRAGSGKNAVAGMTGGHQIAFADPMKAFVMELFDFTHPQVWGPSEERNRPDPRYTRPTGEPLTPRFALQTLGTEWGRNCDPDIWVKCGLRRAAEWLEGCAARGVASPIVTITDCRFINEARAVREAGGQVWRVVRPGAGLSGAAGLHPSEQEQESDEFEALVNVTIYNRGTLADLDEKVQAALNYMNPHPTTLL